MRDTKQRKITIGKIIPVQNIVANNLTSTSNTSLEKPTKIELANMVLFVPTFAMSFAGGKTFT